MKRIIAMVCMILSFSVLTASADTIVIPVQVAGAQYAGEHVGPAGANLDGVAIVGGITCLDYNVTTYIPNPGFTVAIETLDPLNLTNARFYSAADPDGSLLMYQEAAWLNTQLHLIVDSTVIGEIQFAIWRIFNPTASSGASADNVNAENAWMALALATVTDPLLSFDYSSVIIYTPDGKNQEFISGGAVLLGAPAGSSVPEPAAMVLFGFGLVGVASLRKKK